MVHIGNSTWRYGVWSVACFPACVLQVVAAKSILRLSSKDVEHG